MDHKESEAYMSKKESVEEIGVCIKRECVSVVCDRERMYKRVSE